MNSSQPKATAAWRRWITRLVQVLALLVPLILLRLPPQWISKASGSGEGGTETLTQLNPAILPGGLRPRAGTHPNGQGERRGGLPLSIRSVERPQARQSPRKGNGQAALGAAGWQNISSRPGHRDGSPGLLTACKAVLRARAQHNRRSGLYPDSSAGLPSRMPGLNPFCSFVSGRFAVGCST